MTLGERRDDDRGARPAAARPGGRGGPATRGGRLLATAVVATVVMGLLAAAGYGFVLKSLPYRTPTLPPPRVLLTAQDVASLADYPHGVAAVPVLTWRDVSDRPGNLVTSPVRFATQLAALRAGGFHSVRLGALEDLAAGHRVALPDRPVALAFDDGLSIDWTTVDPILRRYGFTGIVFVNPADVAIKSPSYFLTHDELNAMASSGRWDVGVQIPTQRRFVPVPGRPDTPAPESVRAWRARTASDAARARAELEQVTGREVTAFAWPVLITNNDDDRAAPGVLYPALERKFSAVFGRPVAGAANFAGASPVGTPIPRVEITAGDTLPSLSQLLRSGVPAPPPRVPLTLPWQASGGTCQPSASALELTAHGFVLCSVAANGHQWRNYKLHVAVTAPADVTAVIEVRVASADRIEVAISRSGLSIKQHVRKRWILLRHVPAAAFAAPRAGASPLLGAGPLPVIVRAAGSTLQVEIRKVTVSVRVSPSLDHGIIALGMASRRHASVTYRPLWIVAAAG